MHASADTRRSASTVVEDRPALAAVERPAWCRAPVSRCSISPGASGKIGRYALLLAFVTFIVDLPRSTPPSIAALKPGRRGAQPTRWCRLRSRST
jgi:hypothetical protein